MSTANATAPAWKNYHVGTSVTIADGRTFRITGIQSHRTVGGYKSRRFDLSGPNGETVRKSSRGITLWVAGLEDDAGEVIVKPVAAPVVKDDVVRHVRFEALLRIVSIRKNAWLYGGAGGGKTTIAEQVAKALSLPYYSVSVGLQTTQASLLGYHDATGQTVRTQLREAFEHGGVFLLDEVDSGSPAVLVCINSLLANDKASFPDRVVDKHPDFILIAGANTAGHGADRKFNARQQIDAATLDRFVFLDFPYDPRIEAVAAGVSLNAVREAAAPAAHEFIKESDESCQGRCELYVERVVKLRNAVQTFGDAVRVVISPRASTNGTALIRQGFRNKDVLELCVWKGLDTGTRQKIEAAAGL